MWKPPSTGLRKKGLSKAAKKSGRIAADGLIGIIAKGKEGAVVEVNSETDFVARNDQFQGLVRDVAALAPAAKGDLGKLLAATYPGTSNSVETHVKEMVATIGENMSVRRTAYVAVGDGVVADYIHNRVADGLGKIGVLVALESAGDKPTLFELGRMIAMHVAAAEPGCARSRQRSSGRAGARAGHSRGKEPGQEARRSQEDHRGRIEELRQGKLPPAEQAYIHDTGKTVAQALKEAEGKAGSAIKLTGFVRYALGEGIDKKEEDFAAEVAKAVGGAR